MTIEEMNNKRIEHGLTYKDISAGTSLPLSTVQKIFGGMTKAPRRETVVRLQTYLQGFAVRQAREQDDAASVDCACDSSKETYAQHSFSPSFLKESSTYKSGSMAKKQGEYTLDDYYALPDDVRAELIDPRGAFLSVGDWTPTETDLL